MVLLQINVSQPEEEVALPLGGWWEQQYGEGRVAHLTVGSPPRVPKSLFSLSSIKPPSWSATASKTHGLWGMLVFSLSECEAGAQLP